MDERKICFIACVTDDIYEQEMIKYISSLEIPGEGYSVDYQCIRGAKSMASGYNEGMRSSDAKYKVYLHQDVFIWNRRFLYHLLEVFEDKRIGMVGVLGGNDIPDNGVLYSAWNVGMAYACDTQDAGVKQGQNPKKGTCLEVEAIDGMIMATQYDIPWREDLFQGWDFYDISQSFEFRKQGYAVVVPYQEEPWCMHDCGRTKLAGYDAGRKTLLLEYPMFFRNPTYRQEDFSFNHELKELYDKLKGTIIGYMEQGNLDAASQCCQLFDDSDIMDSDLSILKKIVSICEAEKQLYNQNRTWPKGEGTFESVRGTYNRAKFMLWDIERNQDNGVGQLKEALRRDMYSMPLLVLAGIHNSFHFKELLCVLAEIVESKGDAKDLQYLGYIAKQVL